jgi:hypothetical protein
MKQQLKLIIKQVIAEELQQEGKGYLRGAALAGLMALGGSKLMSSASSDKGEVTQQKADSVRDLADFVDNTLGPSLDRDFAEEFERPQRLVTQKVADIKNFSGDEEGLFEELRLLAVRLRNAGVRSSDVDEYMSRYFQLKASRTRQ